MVGILNVDALHSPLQLMKYGLTLPSLHLQPYNRTVQQPATDESSSTGLPTKEELHADFRYLETGETSAGPRCIKP